MKNLYYAVCLPFLVLLSTLALGQSNIPICSAFNTSGQPVDTTGSTNCTDYFGAGNYANSPLPAGTITGFTLIAGGSGYTNPLVVIADPTGANATGTAVLTADVVTAVNVGTGGSGYIMPQISIVDVGVGGALGAPMCGSAGQPACGSGALATAIIGPPFTGGMRKFRDSLPSLSTAAPDTTTFPGSDFYAIGLTQYTTLMHADLAPTTLRGYCQLSAPSYSACASGPSYLGPVILAQKNRPVRVLFKNMLPTGAGGNLFVPVDTTYMGAGAGFSENRATLHLHGGVTPWISDGTPHQWTAPAGEGGALRGASLQFVPDMWFDSSGNLIVNDPTCQGQPKCAVTGATNDPGAGNITFFWTNQQGGRLMFYHDHAYGITRLNVYAGEAAGYLLYDPAEETALAAATAPGTITPSGADLPHLIPLVIQDKTFVPSAAQISVQDPTWAANFGTTPGAANTGDLWFPHVYTPNQNPNDPTGANGFGRWDYGAWFFPPMTSLSAANPPTAVTTSCTSSAYPGQTLAPSSCPSCGCPITPNASGTPESFMDTPVLNGKAYPVLHVAPAAYRFQILSAGNDRSWNLSWFLADATQNDTEVAMLPAVPPASGTALPLCSAINQVAIPSLDMGLATGLLDGTGNPLNGTGLPSGCWPNYGPQPGIPSAQTMWYAEGGTSGAPDPRNAGPAWIQIGSEGGLLPAPVVIPPTPINYELNTRSVTVTNVAVHGLWLGPAERADVIVDFSQFGGKTLILYNDAPTPAPGFDSRLDYFTGDGDQSPIGGAPNTPPGYGPNTRTIMQVVVDGSAANSVPFSLRALKSAFASTATTPGVFAATQPTTIVPEAAYNSAYAKTFPNVYASIQANTLTFTPIQPLTFEALLSGEPSVCGSTTSPVQCASLNQKTIQELFTLDYGRMNATLGTELPLTNFTTQTTLPLAFVDPPTEVVRQGDTQLWKITHNGVDTHFIHFHLFNVQVVNRMGWDGTVRPPDANEMGWKDTVRMNPLEDILVALQPITPQLPWPIPNSIRLEDPVRSPGYTGADFSNIDPFTGGGAATTNDPTNFGWEYVWHCHILGHEENDMMRPIVFQVPPAAPSNLTAVESTTPPLSVTLTFTDNSASETGFTIERDIDPAFPNPITISVGASTPMNAAGEGTTWGGPITATDNTVVGSTLYYYRVQAIDDGFKAPPSQAYNSTPPVLSGWSNTVSLSTVPILPMVTFTGAPASAAYNTTFTVTATTNASTMPTITPTGVCTVGPVTGTPASATATVTMTSGTGTCSLSANWAADRLFLATSATQTTNATLATPTVSFTGAPASAAFQSNFTVTATTDASSMPTIAGTAGVCIVGAVSGTAASTTALVTMSSGTGSCVLTANWAADANYLAAGPLSQTTTATKKAPTVGLAGAPASAVYNTTFIVTATTNASDATTSPSITGTPGICTVSTVGGTFVTTTATVTMISGTGTCIVAANWAATANYSAAGPATQTTAAAKAGSATSILAHTPNPSVVGQAVPVTFSVTGTGVGPTGNVTVKATTGESCTGTVAAGTCSLIFVTTGTRTMTATYAGDANFNGSSSAASTSQNVLDFVLGIRPGSQSVNGGQRASFTVTATAIGGVPMPLTLTCAINQPAYTCSVSPTSVTPNGGTKNATVYVNTVKNHAGTWTLTVTGVDTQTGFTLTHTVTGQLSVKN